MSAQHRVDEQSINASLAPTNHRKWTEMEGGEEEIGWRREGGGVHVISPVTTLLDCVCVNLSVSNEKRDK